MNEVIPLTFLVDPESVAKQIRDDLKANKDLLARSKARNKAKLVALVEIQWYMNLMQWLMSQNENHPGPISNHKLYKDGKLETSKKLGQDFVAISIEGWEILMKYFKGGPKVLRNLVLNPKTQKPCILTNPIQIEIVFNEKTYRKHVDESWKVGPIKKLLCKTLEINHNDFVFLDSKKETKIYKDKRISDVIRENPGAWNLVLTEAAQNKPPTGITLDGHEPAEVRLFNSDVVFSFLTIPLYSFFYIDIMRELMFNPELHNMISKVNTGTNVGKAAAIIRKIFRELNEESKDQIDPDVYFTFICRAYDEFQNDDTRSVTQAIHAILTLLHNDTIKEDATSPISEIFGGEFHITLECEVCHEFTDKVEKFKLVSVPIPNSPDDVCLDDCIASFSLPEEVPVLERGKCQNCCKLSPSTRYKTIRKIGNALIVYIRRFLIGGIFEKKITTFVKFPFELKSAAFVSEIDDTFVLKSVIFHKGEIESAEYTVAVNTKDGWIYIDSHGACKIDPEELINPEALILFYEKK